MTEPMDDKANMVKYNALEMQWSKPYLLLSYFLELQLITWEHTENNLLSGT
jgi:hypothetical protein